MAGPLDGIRIVDFTTMIAGPYAAMILADQGADVIKIEAPIRSDHVRPAGQSLRRFSAAFLNNNRNKRSLSVDAKTEAGRELMLKLTQNADVFIQNYRPGVMARLGIDEPQLRTLNPRLIYVSMSGWGESGPYAHKPVYDPIIQALSGLTSVQGGSDQARPRLIRTILPDKLTGITAAQAVTAALVSRGLTGQGQHVRVSMLDAVVAFMWSSDMGGQTFVGEEVSSERAATFIDLIYETKSDYISVSVMSDEQWRGLCEAVGHPEWLEDERFTTAAGRDRHANERLELTQSALLDKNASEWLEILDAVVETEPPHAGRLRQARNAARFEATPTEIRHGAPHHGEHTRAIMSELGFNTTEIDDLISAGVIGDFQLTPGPST